MCWEPSLRSMGDIHSLIRASQAPNAAAVGQCLHEGPAYLLGDVGLLVSEEELQDAALHPGAEGCPRRHKGQCEKILKVGSVGRVSAGVR